MGHQIFSRILSPDFFSSFFCGKKCPEKSFAKISGKILQNVYNKNPRHISAEGPGQSLGLPEDCARLLQNVVEVAISPYLDMPTGASACRKHQDDCSETLVDITIWLCTELCEINIPTKAFQKEFIEECFVTLDGFCEPKIFG